MLFTVVNKDRTSVGYELDPAKTVLDLKEAICDRTDMDLNTFRLTATIKGRSVPLEDTHTLESYGLDTESQIRIVGSTGISRQVTA